MPRINAYGKQFGATGFRAGILYRNQSWFNLLDFEYDMSVPNVAHLDPQRGGCCTVMPYFVGKVLEIPVTTTQDYSLFHILGDYSTRLWERQIEMIMEKHGLISMIVHPDYLAGEREKSLYEALLAHLTQLRTSRQLWITTPGEVNRWWRQSAEMEIVEVNGKPQIEGPGKERACIAYATENNGRLEFDVQPFVRQVSASYCPSQKPPIYPRAIVSKICLDGHRPQRRASSGSIGQYRCSVLSGTSSH